MKRRTAFTLTALLAGMAIVAVAGARYLTAVPGQSHQGVLPPSSDAETATAARLLTHIRAVASKPHNIEHYDELEKSARYIEDTLSALGYRPVPQVYEVEGRTVRNIEAVIEPARPDAATRTIVVGAHYDSYDDTPGANDNGSGTAAVLELARLLADLRNTGDKRIRLVLFVNEEPPYFQTPDMGSHRYAKLLAERREPVIGMISLETLGCFLDYPGSQKYPPPLGLLYPSKGDFVAFVAMTGSRELMQSLIGSFRKHTQFPSVGGVAPGFVPGIDWSDHWSFEEFRYPAVMITDTAYFRYPHYHKVTDTPDKVDVGKLARIAHGVARVIREMAGPDWPAAASASR
ncbi:MAG: M28 family peptidase [Xanthobacteraceae bacterium]|nr:M28 family peptidase [Xanthobacteraceae bacterium]